EDRNPHGKGGSAAHAPHRNDRPDHPRPGGGPPRRGDRGRGAGTAETALRTRLHRGRDPAEATRPGRLRSGVGPVDAHPVRPRGPHGTAGVGGAGAGGNRTAARFRDGRPAAGHRPPRPRRRPGGADGRRPRDGREGAGAGVPLTLLEGGAAPVVAVGGLLAVPVLSSTGGGPVFLTALTVWGAVLGLS